MQKFLLSCFLVTLVFAIGFLVLTPSVKAGYLTIPVQNYQVNSFFDHDSPNYNENNLFIRYDGSQWTNTSSCQLGVNCYDGHNGVDLEGITGDDIITASGGTIQAASYDACLGNYIRLWHSNEGDSTLYGHLSQFIVTSGSVSRFQHIAEMGSTGTCTTGDHLHFGVYDAQTGGHAMDPYGWSGTGNDPWSYNQGYLWTTNPPSLNAATSATSWNFNSSIESWSAVNATDYGIDSGSF